MSFLFLSAERAETLRAGIRQGRPGLCGVARKLSERAGRAMPLGPWSVTYHPSRAASGDPHDYYSEGPYWWPDPADPGGPYVRRDGEVNPDYFTAHRFALRALCEAVRDLSLAGFYLDRPDCARRAGELLQVWFVDAGTRMSPHLECGQAIPGICDGRGIGIIDAVPLIALAYGLGHLARCKGHPVAVVAETRAWLAEYLRWLRASRKGLAEKREANNHGTFWAAQVMALALATGDTEAAVEIEERYRSVLIPSQVEPDGRCPLEEARTRGLGYSLFNAEAYALICEMAYHRGVDLWRFRMEDGRGIEAVASYLAPFCARPETWPGRQIAPVAPGRRLFLQLAGAHLGRPDLLALGRTLPPAEDALLAPMDLLETGAP